MKHLILNDQKCSDLTKDVEITHLSIKNAWLKQHTHEQITQLSQLYTGVVFLDLSDIDLVRVDQSKIITLLTTFPEITELELREGSEVAANTIQHISLALKFLKKTSFTLPPKVETSTFSYLNPFTWSLPFWTAYQEDTRTSATAEAQHHDTLRDLFSVSNINTGKNNILSDWNRLEGGLLEINGELISTLVQPNKSGEYFTSLEELKSFFQKNLLYKLPKERQQQALADVMNCLHQGGLKNPVTASFYQYCASNDSLPQPVDAKHIKHGVPGQHRHLRFDCTDNGFRVHETLTQNRLVYPITSDKAGQFVSPDDGETYVFKAEAILSMLWDGSKGRPKITVDKVGITFGNATIKNLFDERWFYQRWMDNVGYYLGYNTVEEPSSLRM